MQGKTNVEDTAISILNSKETTDSIIKNVATSMGTEKIYVSPIFEISGYISEATTITGGQEYPLATQSQMEAHFVPTSTNCTIVDVEIQCECDLAGGTSWKRYVYKGSNLVDTVTTVRAIIPQLTSTGIYLTPISTVSPAIRKYAWRVRFVHDSYIESQ